MWPGHRVAALICSRVTHEWIGFIECGTEQSSWKNLISLDGASVDEKPSDAENAVL
jgi:hypothetical protein